MSVSGVMEYVKHKLDPKLLHKENKGVYERPKVTSGRLSEKESDVCCVVQRSKRRDVRN